MVRLSSGSVCALCAVAGCITLFGCLQAGPLSVQLLGTAQELLGLDSGQSERRERLEAIRTVALARSRARRATSQALAEGRLTLIEAGARLQEFARTARVFRWQDFRICVPGNSDEERFCHEAIDCAEAELVNQPERARAVRQRLEAELCQALQRGLLRAPLVSK